MRINSSRNFGRRYIFHLDVGRPAAVSQEERMLELTVDEKLRRDDRGRKKAGRRVEQSNSRLLSHIREMAEVPRDQVIDLVKRRERHVDRVGNEFSVKDAA